MSETNWNYINEYLGRQFRSRKSMKFSGREIVLRVATADLAVEVMRVLEAARSGDCVEMRQPIADAISRAEQVLIRLKDFGCNEEKQ